MIKKVLFIIPLIMLFLPIVAADLDIASLEGEELEGIAAQTFGNQRINIYIDGELLHHFVTEDGLITQAGDGGLDNPTLSMYSDEATFNEVTESDDPMGTFATAILDERITYAAVGFFNGFRFAIISFLMNFMNIFNAPVVGDCDVIVGSDQQFTTITEAFDYAEEQECEELIIDLYPGEYEDGYLAIQRDTTIHGTDDGARAVGILKNRVKIKNTSIENLGGHLIDMKDLTLKDGSRIRANHRSSETILEDMTIRHGKNFGVRQYGGFLRMNTVFVLDTDIEEENMWLPNTGWIPIMDIDHGSAVLIANRAEAVLEDVHLRNNEGGALRMMDRGTKVYVNTIYVTSNDIDSEVVIADFTENGGITAFAGRAVVEVRNRAKLLMENAQFDDNQFIGLLVLNGGRAHVRDVDFMNSRKINTDDAYTAYGGSNIVIKQDINLLGETGDAELELHDFLTIGADGSGLAVYGGLVTGAEGNITENTFGMSLVPIDGVEFDVRCIADRVFAYGNGQDVSRMNRVLPVPDPDRLFVQEGQERDEALCAEVPFNCNWCD
jgi:hypothetical protein